MALNSAMDAVPCFVVEVIRCYEEQMLGQQKRIQKSDLIAKPSKQPSQSKAISAQCRDSFPAMSRGQKRLTTVTTLPSRLGRKRCTESTGPR